MKKFLSAVVFASLTASYAFGASVPVQTMTPYSLGIEYQASMNGHPVLYMFDNSVFVSHMGKLHYSPFKFIRLSAGIGATQPYDGDRTEAGFMVSDGAKMGFSATGGAALYLPKILPVLSITAGYDGSYLKFTEADSLFITDDLAPEELYTFEKVGKTTGKLHVPYAGLIFHPSKYLDFEIGGLYRIFDGKKKLTYTLEDTPVLLEIEERVKEFGVYGSFTVHDPESGAYLNAGASTVPTVEKKYKTGSWFTRTSLNLSIGVILKDKSLSSGKSRKTRTDMELRQEEMAAELRGEVIYQSVDETEQSDDGEEYEDDYGDDEEE